MRTSRTRSIHLARGLVALLLSASLVACSDGGSDDSGSKSSSGSSSPSKPKAARPVESIDALSGRSTAVKLDPGFVKALASLYVEPRTLGTAKLTRGSLVFPITGGNLSYFKPGTRSPYVIGQLQHEGSGLSLVLADTLVDITNLNVDPGASRVYGDVSVNGKLVAPSAYVFSLDGRTLKAPLNEEGATVLTGTKVAISKDAAPLLDKTFRTHAIKRGMHGGVATITISTS